MNPLTGNKKNFNLDSDQKRVLHILVHHTFTTTISIATKTIFCATYLRCNLD